MRILPISFFQPHTMEVKSQLIKLLVNTQHFILFKTDLDENLTYIFFPNTHNEGLEPTDQAFSEYFLKQI